MGDPEQDLVHRVGLGGISYVSQLYCYLDPISRLDTCMKNIHVI